MSEAKHTPGPWAAESPEKVMLGERWRITAPTPKGKRRYTVAVLTDHSTDPADHATTAADASLIAAAPELLAHLQFAVALLSPVAAFGATPQVEAMRAAIRKATGQ